MGFSSHAGMTDLVSKDLDPDLSFMMGVSSGSFFIDAFGIGYLVHVKQMGTEEALTEVILP